MDLLNMSQEDRDIKNAERKVLECNNVNCKQYHNPIKNCIWSKVIITNTGRCYIFEKEGNK